MRVVVIGAGISGLTAGHELVAASVDRGEAPPKVVVLEADERIGGKIRTRSFAGHAVDGAADAFLARVPDAVDLCRQLDLYDQLESPAAHSAFVYSRGALRRFPEGTVLGVPTDIEALRASGVISPEGVARAELDLTMGDESGEPARTAEGGYPDETVGSLVRRRVGDEVFERLVGPLLSGVNAGDADRLSVQAGAAQLAAAVSGQPSLIAGLRAQRAAAGTDPDAPVFFGLPTGTATLTNTLATRIDEGGGRIHLNTRVERIDATSGGGYVVHTDRRGPFRADAVVLATPDPVSAALLAPHAPDVAAGLADVEYASVTMVAFAIPRDLVDHPLDGSGFLVAHPEGLLLTACSWASSKWAHLADPELAILRASAGRIDDRRADELDDTALVDALLADLATTMGPIGRPSQIRVSRWPEALPQFRPGHLQRVAAWDAELASGQPGLALVGAGLEGLGIPACVRRARVAIKALRERAQAAKIS